MCTFLKLTKNVHEINCERIVCFFNKNVEFFKDLFYWNEEVNEELKNTEIKIKFYF